MTLAGELSLARMLLLQLRSRRKPGEGEIDFALFLQSDVWRSLGGIKRRYKSHNLALGALTGWLQCYPPVELAR